MRYAPGLDIRPRNKCMSEVAKPSPSLSFIAAPVVVKPANGSTGSLIPTTKKPLDLGALLKKVEQAQAQKKRAKPGTKSPAKRRKKVADRPLPTPASMCTLWSSRLQALKTTIVGIDMSLSNPGLCILDPCLRTIHLWCFRNRVKDSNGMTIVKCPESVFCGWLFQVTIIEEWPESKGFSLPRFARYEARVKALMAIIGQYKPKTIVGIEHYAFSVTATRGDSTLKELGGILRRELCYAGHQIVEIVPSQVKRIFCDNGDSKKKDMYKAYSDLYKLPDLFAIMNIKRVVDTNGGLETVAKKKKSEKPTIKTPRKKRAADDIPHPIEDMVDALGVVMAVIDKL